MSARSISAIALLAGSMMIGCSRPLDTKGAVSVSLLNEDKSLAAGAEKAGIQLSQRVDALSWYPRLLADMKTDSTAQLYVAEWSRVLLELSRQGLLAETGAL